MQRLFRILDIIKTILEKQKSVGQYIYEELVKSCSHCVKSVARFVTFSLWPQLHIHTILILINKSNIGRSCSYCTVFYITKAYII